MLWGPNQAERLPCFQAEFIVHFDILLKFMLYANLSPKSLSHSFELTRVTNFDNETIWLDSYYVGHMITIFHMAGHTLHNLVQLLQPGKKKYFCDNVKSRESMPENHLWDNLKVISGTT